MQQYELGGVKFIIHEGDVYVLHRPVEQTDQIEQIVGVDEDPKPRKKKRDAKAIYQKWKSTKGRNKCGKCGEYGHKATTCKFGQEKKPTNPLHEKVRLLVEQGASDGEIYESVRHQMTDAQFRAALDEARDAA